MEKTITVKVECSNDMEYTAAVANLQRLATRLKGKGINKFMGEYDKNKTTVEAFLILKGC